MPSINGEVPSEFGEYRRRPRYEFVLTVAGGKRQRSCRHD